MRKLTNILKVIVLMAVVLIFSCRSMKVNANEINLLGITSMKPEKVEQVVRGNLIDKDYDILLKVVESEAYGCTLQQKINVASCILNRALARNRWGNDIYSVVTQPNQFMVITNGFYNMVDISKDTIKAVEYVRYNGVAHDCEFFCTPEASTTSIFFKKLTPEFFDGAHNYYLYK